MREPPFWGRPGRTRPELPSYLRRTELEIQSVTGARPKSVFQVGGAGTVGTGSLRGMPYLAELADAGFSVWPFHPPERPLVLEIYPRLLTGKVVKSDPAARVAYLDEALPGVSSELRETAATSHDALDAAVSAVVMARHVEEIEALEQPKDPMLRKEGAIWRPSASSSSSPSPSSPSEASAAASDGASSGSSGRSSDGSSGDSSGPTSGSSSGSSSSSSPGASAQTTAPFPSVRPVASSTSVHPPEPEDLASGAVGCPFCIIDPGQAVAESEHAIAFRDVYPVSEGHTLVIPRKHVESVFELPGAVQQDLWRLVARIRSKLVDELDTRDFNVGLNDGRAAGQTILHGHIHVIPRCSGDVDDPRGGIRWVLPEHAAYWE